jgi:hypothetical protein
MNKPDIFLETIFSPSSSAVEERLKQKAAKIAKV